MFSPTIESVNNKNADNYFYEKIYLRKVSESSVGEDANNIQSDGCPCYEPNDS